MTATKKTAPAAARKPAARASRADKEKKAGTGTRSVAASQTSKPKPPDRTAKKDPGGRTPASGTKAAARTSRAKTQASAGKTAPKKKPIVGKPKAAAKAKPLAAKPKPAAKKAAAKTKPPAAKPKTAARKPTAKTKPLAAKPKPAARKPAAKTKPPAAKPKTAARKPTAKTKPLAAKPKTTARKPIAKTKPLAAKPKTTARKPAAKTKPLAAKPKPATRKPAAKTKPPAAKPKTAAKTTPAKKSPPKKATPKRPLFRQNDNAIYPAHGVGRILGIEKQKTGKDRVETSLLVIYFEREKMTLRIPADSASERGLRPLSSLPEIRKALKILTGPAKIRRMMWSRRAQEYETKINSGSLISVAEVVRDLHRADDQGQSYSERQLYDEARNRLTQEIMAVQKASFLDASARIDETLLQRTP